MTLFVIMFVLLALAAAWTRDDYKRAFTALAGVWGIIGIGKCWGGPATLLSDPLRALGAYGMVVGFIAMALVLWYCDVIERREGQAHVVQHFLWGTFQQLLLLGFLSEATQSPWIAGGIFALLHVPNPFLTILTFVAGLASSTLYLDFGIQAILIAGFYHALLSYAVDGWLPERITQGMTIGLHNWERWWKR